MSLPMVKFDDRAPQVGLAGVQARVEDQESQAGYSEDSGFRQQLMPQ